MKIILDEKDEKTIKNINDDIAAGNKPMLYLNEIGREYSFEFTCTDIGRANLFAYLMMRPDDFGKEFQEIFGIRCERIRYVGKPVDVTNLRAYLTECLNKLDNM